MSEKILLDCVKFLLSQNIDLTHFVMPLFVFLFCSCYRVSQSFSSHQNSRVVCKEKYVVAFDFYIEMHSDCFVGQI